MKKLLLLGGAQYLLPVIEEAHKLGLYVITCDYLPDNIAHKHSDEYRNVSIIDKDAVLSTARELGIDGIMSFACDPGVVTAAYVAEKLGLPFAGSYEAVSILQNKGPLPPLPYRERLQCPLGKELYRARRSALRLRRLQLADDRKARRLRRQQGRHARGFSRRAPHRDRARQGFLDLRGFIIEEFITQQGFSSDTDCFSVDGMLRYCSFDEQHFDAHADNPYTPAAYAWPSTMPAWAQAELRGELQRLITLLGLGTGLYNIETRLGTNGRTYIMEVSPRGGGNRLSEVLSMAAETNLVANAVKAAVGLPVDEMCDPVYNGHWTEIILHSGRDGTFRALEIAPELESAVVQRDLWVKPGDAVERFSGANKAIGTLVMNFPTREDAEKYMADDSWYSITVD
ncbi:MAG: carboxylate--amine ligase [Oscillospiraceae bacterium]